MFCGFSDLIVFYRFAGDTADLGIIRGGKPMKVEVVLNPRVHLVCYNPASISFIIA